MSQIDDYLDSSSIFYDISLKELDLKQKKSKYLVIDSENEGQDYFVQDSHIQSQQSMKKSLSVLNNVNIKNLANIKNAQKSMKQKRQQNKNNITKTIKMKKNLELEEQRVRQQIKKVDSECIALEKLINQVIQKEAQLTVKKHKLVRNKNYQFQNDILRYRQIEDSTKTTKYIRNGRKSKNYLFIK